MKLSKVTKIINNILKNCNIENPSLESIIITSHALKKDDLFILSNPDFNIDYLFYKKMIKYANDRIAGKPISYITHKKEFMGLQFYVNKHVLIPRPETENLVEEAIEYIKKYKLKNVLDVCTGSGAIAISIAYYTNCTVVASDISYKALQVANINKKLLKTNVFLVNCDVLSAFKSNFDIVVSNPPYILPSEYDFLSKEVRHEPHIALFCDDKFSIIKKIIEQSKYMAKFLIMEISPNIRPLLESYRELANIKQDYSGLDRIAIFRF